MNLIDIPTCFTVNGKKLTQPQKNLLAKLQTNYGFDVDTDVTSAQNLCSGQVFDNLNSMVAALVNFCTEAYRTYGMHGYMIVNGKKFTVQDYDRTKYLVLALDSRAYSNLLD